MGGIAVKKGNASTSYTGTKYQFDAGVKHLYIRTSTGVNDVISYPLTTETSASQYCSLAFKVGDQTCYLASRTSGDSVFQTLPSGNVSTTNSNTQRVQLDSQTYIDSAHGFSTATYYRYSTQSNYSLRNSANQTYTSTNFIINTEGITKSASATYTVQQASSTFITSTSNSNATSSRTDNSVVGMPIYSSSTYQIQTGTSPVNYNTTRVSNYSTTYYNNTGYGTTTSSTTSSSYTMGSSYMTSYNSTASSSTITRAWINIVSAVTNSNGGAITSYDGTYSTRWTSFTNFSDYQRFTVIEKLMEPTASTSGDFKGYYVTNMWVEDNGNGIGASFYSTTNNSNTTNLGRYYTVQYIAYTATSLYGSTTGTRSVSRNTTQTSYDTTDYRYPTNATTYSSTTEEYWDGYAPSNTLMQASGWATSSSYYANEWKSTSVSSVNYVYSSSTTEQRGYVTTSTSNYTSVSTTLKNKANSSKLGQSAAYGGVWKSKTYETQLSTTSHGTLASNATSYVTFNSSVTRKSSYDISRSSKGTDGTKVSMTAWGHRSITAESYYHRSSYVKTYSLKGYKTGQVDSYGTSTKYSYSSTYTQSSSTTVGATTSDVTHFLWTMKNTQSTSSSAYQRAAATSTTYSNNVTRPSNQYQTSSITTYYSYQSRYTQTSSTKYSSYSNRTYYISSTKFTFTKTTSSHNVNI